MWKLSENNSKTSEGSGTKMVPRVFGKRKKRIQKIVEKEKVSKCELVEVPDDE